MPCPRAAALIFRSLPSFSREAAGFQLPGKCYSVSMSNTDKTTQEPSSLVNQFLIAMPQLQDSYFAHTVIYIWRHSEEGALGLVVNLPIKMQMDEVFEQLGVAYLKN